MSIEERLADYYETHAEELAQRLHTALEASGDPGLATIPAARLTEMLQVPFKTLATALRGDPEPFFNYSRQTIQRRAQQANFKGDNVSTAGVILYAVIRSAVDDLAGENELERAQARAALAELTFRFNQSGYETLFKLRQADLDRREADLSEIQTDYDRVTAALRELSAPIAPIHDNVLVLPLVGSIDTDRAQMLTEDLLETIVDRQSDLVIIDITGVPVVDTNIANYLLQITRAVNLLGAQVILVGISAEVAQTIVGLDLDLRQLTVRANLQDGIEFALAQLGLGIRPLESSDDR